MTDEEVITKLRGAKNKEKFTKLFDHGNTKDCQGGRSEADLSLVSIITFYTQDPKQIDQLFQKSKLCREKWGSREDYRQMTINKALSSLKATYQSSQKKETDEDREKLQVFGIGEFLSKKIPERKIILSPWIREQGTILLYAWRGIGKTFFGLNIGYAIASGGEFLGWEAPEPRKVLYVDGEMPASVLQERLSNIVRRNNEKVVSSDDYFQILPSDLQENGMGYIDNPLGQLRMMPFIDKTDVVIIDNLSTLTCNQENDSQAWVPVQEWILKLRRMRKVVILIHHAGKGGDQRGHSKKEDIMDVVIKLVRPKDYSEEEGARFELYFKKSRGLCGKSITPMEIRAIEENGIIHWKYRDVESYICDRIKEYKGFGMSDKEIISELEISRATFYRHKKKLQNP